jgi:hypothetical protein
MAHCSLRPKPSAVALVILGAAPSALNGQVVHGRVLDFDTDAPLATATVTILEGEDGGRRLGTAISAADGRFRLRAPGTGTYRLVTDRLGYATVVTPPFDLVLGEEPLDVELRLRADAIPLAPLTILSPRPPRLNLRLETRGFYDRRRSWGREGLGMGHFIDREQIERRGPVVFSDLLQDLPGVRIEYWDGRRRTITMRSTVSLGERRCEPIIFIDGVPAAGAVWAHLDGPARAGLEGAFDIDDLVSPADIVAVEVYPGISQPGEFMRGVHCGSVVVWTGAPDRRPATRPR